MLPVELVHALEELFRQKEGVAVAVSKCRRLGGGSINEACMVEIGGRNYFVKWNNKNLYPGMFAAEAHGLQLLASTQTLRVPGLIAEDNSGSWSYLLLEYIQTGFPDAAAWEQFGAKLAALHRNTSPFFGLDRDNYIGSLPQTNAPSYASWPEFFVECRLRPQLQLAVRKGLLNSALQKQFETLFAKMEKLFPLESPSLLHGDLWSGNYLFSARGEAFLIDPAVYYGHREMDLAMSLLFGGFDRRFYQAYHEAWPLEPGWRERVDLCNLYPLMVHVNLFGSGYINQVRSILEHFD